MTDVHVRCGYTAGQIQRSTDAVAEVWHIEFGITHKLIVPARVPRIRIGPCELPDIARVSCLKEPRVEALYNNARLLRQTFNTAVLTVLEEAECTVYQKVTCILLRNIPEAHLYSSHPSTG